MKAQTPAEGILKSNDWGDTKSYHIVCTCGCDDHTINLVVEADDSHVTVMHYTTQSTDFWSEAVKPRYDIDNDWLQEFDWFWKGLVNGLVLRLRLTKDIWFKGQAKFESTTIMTEQQALNYAETLKSAVADCKKIREGKAK